MFTAGSLFSGIGGIDLAMSLAGFDIRWQVEIDDFCRKVLAKHSWDYWKHATQFTDVRRVTARSGKGWRGYQRLESVDVLFGGFPCQDISIAGKRAGIREGSRSGLWGEFRRLISEIRPRAMLLENVPNITRIGGTTVIADLAALGYDAKWGVISAQDAGATHIRERWWCIAVDNTESNGNQRIRRGMGEAQTEARKQNDGRKSLSESQNLEYAYSERQQAIHATTSNAKAGFASWRHGTVRPAINGLTPQSRMGRNAHGLPARLDGDRLMALEYPAAPNQTQHAWEPPRVAPKDRYTNARLKALGNAVVPGVVYPIALELHKLLTQRSLFAEMRS